MRPLRRMGPSAGFTLLETMVVVAVLGVLTYSLGVTVSASQRSQLAVISVASEGRTLRTTFSTLVEELRASSSDTITVTELADKNHELSFMLPITVDGADGWGVYEPKLLADEHAGNEQDWRVQYTVVSQVDGSGGVTRSLWRRVVDADGNVQSSNRLIQGLRSGSEDPPGFQAVLTGDVWVITLSTEGVVDGKTSISAQFHVRPRN